MDVTQTRIHERCMFECALVVKNEIENVALFFVIDVCDTKYFWKQPKDNTKEKCYIGKLENYGS